MEYSESIGAMSITEFCKWAGIGRSLAFQQIARKRLKAKKVGRRTVIPMDAATAWLADLPER